MISVLLIWIYILITTYAAGLILSLPARRIAGYRSDDPTAYILMGLVGVTVYGELVSLFTGVGAAAYISLCVILTASCLLLRHKLEDSFVGIKSLTKNKRLCAISVLIMLIMAYGTSHGIMHYDTGLYHAQAIRWIEEYGAVPGLANLHTRLGYNSSAFVLNALYSFGFTGQSFHVTGGFLALLLAWECMIAPAARRESFMSVSNMARAAGIYYLLMIYDEMVSPASDYYMVTLGFILIIRWLDAAGDASLGDVETTGVLPKLCMLSLLTCYILTIKLSGAMFILLAILPAILLVRSHEFKKLIACVVTGACVIFPYLIRNLILSGWLLYPSTAFDIFDVSWKVPYDTAMYDYKEIQVYGRGYTDVSRYSESATRWVSTWFKSQSATDRILIAAAIVACIYFVVKCVIKVVRSKNRQIKSDDIYTLCAEAVLCVCFIFWIFTSPLMRYGCLYVYLCDAVVWGGLICDLARKYRVVFVIAVASLIALGSYKLVMWTGEVIRGYRSDTWVAQQDYERFETYTYELTGNGGHDKVKIYAPVSGDRCGYYAFPGSPWSMDGYIVLRGDSIDDGFRAVPSSFK